MKRKIVTVISGGAAALIAVICVNTYYGHSRQPVAAPITPIVIDEPVVAQRLAEALKFVTISDPNDPDANADEFDKLKAHIQASFPRVHSALKQERIVGSHALLYTWVGKEPAARPAMWMAHQDVVPIAPGTEREWKHAPFGGQIADGFIWGRGSWDDKGNLFAQLEAIEALLASGFQPRRTIYLAYGADEEVGGKRGAVAIAALLRERGVKLDYVIDEGLLILNGVVPGLAKPAAMLGVAEKGYASFRLDVSVAPGHSSMPPSQTAIGVLGKALGRLEDTQMPLRSEGLAQQLFETLAPEMEGFNRIALSNYWLFRPMLDRKLEKVPSMNALMRTTTAPTMVSAGMKDNVLPGHASATVNFRLLPGDTIADVKEHIRKTVANDAVRISDYGDFNTEASNVASPAAPEFAHLSKTVQEIFPGVVVAPGLMIGASDSRHMQSLSPNVFKFTPLQANPEDLTRFHGTNERVAVTAYSEMIRFYHQLAKNTAQ